MTALTVAIEQQEWEKAALLLLLGVTRAAAALPPDAVEGLLEVLENGPAETRRRGRTGRRSRGARDVGGGPFDELRAGRHR